MSREYDRCTGLPDLAPLAAGQSHMEMAAAAALIPPLVGRVGRRPGWG